MIDSLSRRELLARMAIAMATAVAAAGASGVRAADATPHLDATDSTAAALGYVPDAAKVDASRFKSYRAGQSCSNCTQLQGVAGAEWRPCTLFPNKLVNVNGWCSAYVKQA